MNTVKVSPKYQVEIPPHVRESMGIQIGQKMNVFQHENYIVFIPVRPVQEARGVLEGIDTIVKKESDRL